MAVIGEAMQVIVRVRPPGGADHVIVRPLQDTQSLVVEESSYGVAVGAKTFKFTSVLPVDARQSDVFEHVVPLLRSAMDGFNCTIFTYGQTGTGKTHTMLGYDLWGMAAQADAQQIGAADLADADEEAQGIIPRAVQWLLQRRTEAEALGRTLSVRATYVEIYNERIKDLLASEANEKPTGLDIREDRVKGIHIPGLIEYEITNEADGYEVLWEGARNRAVAATNMNEHSSRSHTVLILRVTSTNLSGQIKTAKVCLVDLAGSEKWKSHQMSSFSEQRIKELTSINQSLSALGACISALLQPSRSHIPYRNSKLTRLLQDSLGGNTRTLFVVTLSPEESNAEETLSTLQFADRAMRVQVHATAQQIDPAGSGNAAQNSEAMRKLQAEVDRLRACLQAIRAAPRLLECVDDGKLSQQVIEEIQTLKAENEQLLEENTRLLELNKEFEAERSNLIVAVLGEQAQPDPREQDGKNAHAVMNVLLRQFKDMDTGADAQRQRKEWLNGYHALLKALPASTERVPVGDRVSMVESSTVLQMEELQNVRRRFVDAKNKLEQRHASVLHEKDAEIEQLEILVQDKQQTIHALEESMRELVGRLEEERAKQDSLQRALEDTNASITKQALSNGYHSNTLQEVVATRTSSATDDHVAASPLDPTTAVTTATTTATATTAQPLNTEATTPQPAPRRKKKPKPLWAEYQDPATGVPYFHNRLTKVTQWERPDETEMGLYLYPDGSVR